MRVNTLHAGKSLRYSRALCWWDRTDGVEEQLDGIIGNHRGDQHCTKVHILRLSRICVQTQLSPG